MSADLAIKAALQIAEAIAMEAEKAAPAFACKSGDVALREFAEAIRRTNRNTDPHT